MINGYDSPYIHSWSKLYNFKVSAEERRNSTNDALPTAKAKQAKPKAISKVEWINKKKPADFEHTPSKSGPVLS